MLPENLAFSGKRGLKAAGAALAVTLLSSPVLATDFTVGLGVGVAPDYQGSDDYEAVPLWVLRADDLYDPSTYVAIEALRFSSNFLPHENFRVGVSGQYVPKRDDPDDNAVDLLDNTDDGVLVGVLLGYDVPLSNDSVLGFEFDPRWDVNDDIGGLATGRVNYVRPINQTWTISGGLEATYASTEYMREFFSIDAAGAAQSGLDEFDADSGFLDAGINLAATYNFTQNWSTTGTVAYKRLFSDAEDSPVTDDRGDANQFFAGVVAAYRF